MKEFAFFLIILLLLLLLLLFVITYDADPLFKPICPFEMYEYLNK